MRKTLLIKLNYKHNGGEHTTHKIYRRKEYRINAGLLSFRIGFMPISYASVFFFFF